MTIQHPRILCVEDDNLVRQLAVEGLREAGYEVLEAKNSAEAMAIMHDPDDISIVFTDVQMPGLDGLWLVAKIREDAPGMPALITSGFSPRLTERLDGLTPPTIFLRKPYRLIDVIAKLRELQAAIPPGGVH